MENDELAGSSRARIIELINMRIDRKRAPNPVKYTYIYIVDQISRVVDEVRF